MLYIGCVTYLMKKCDCNTDDFKIQATIANHYAYKFKTQACIVSMFDDFWTCIVKIIFHILSCFVKLSDKGL